VASGGRDLDRWVTEIMQRASRKRRVCELLLGIGVSLKIVRPQVAVDTASLWPLADCARDS